MRQEPSPTIVLVSSQLWMVLGGAMWPRDTIVSSAWYMPTGLPGLLRSRLTSKKSRRDDSGCARVAASQAWLGGAGFLPWASGQPALATWAGCQGRPACRDPVLGARQLAQAAAGRAPPMQRAQTPCQGPEARCTCSRAGQQRAGWRMGGEWGHARASSGRSGRT